ncbi:MAG TPA: N-acetyltransferase, partial [Puia sp.]|nr:N-acetyltransferase [Puia sp.]
MEFQVIKSAPENAESMRQAFLNASRFQFVHNKCHGAGWSDIYLFIHEGETAGYGSVWGKEIRENRDTIFEFYLKAPMRNYANCIFPEFIKRSGVAFLECQTNDFLLAQMFFGHARAIRTEAILFEDNFETLFRSE